MKKKIIILLFSLIAFNSGGFVNASKKHGSADKSSRSRQHESKSLVPLNFMSSDFYLDLVNPWPGISKRHQDSVVQVYSYNSPFNWLEPYKMSKERLGRGSGFFVKDESINGEGFILTNYHVVSEATFIQITIPSLRGKKLDVEIDHVSPEHDVALLKLTPKSLNFVLKHLRAITYLTLGDSDKVARAQKVLALGYPLGQNRLKSTLGEMSGRQNLRNINFIQISTPINKGNSGGPAIDRCGKVIGINSCGVLSAQNVGYMIPINDVKIVLHNFRRSEKKLLRSACFFGVPGCVTNYTTSELVKYLNNPEPGGCYIAKVFKNTVFYDYGIREGDMLYEVNGQPVDRAGNLTIDGKHIALEDFLRRFQIGDIIDFVVYKKGQCKKFKISIEEKYLRPIRLIYPEFEKEAVDYEVFAGMVVMNLSKNHVIKFKKECPYLDLYNDLEKNYKPALILTHVLPGSQAFKSYTLKPGDIIEEVNGQKVTTVEEFRKAVLKSAQSYVLTIKGKQENRFTALSLSKILKDELVLFDRHKQCYSLSDLGMKLCENVKE